MKSPLYILYQKIEKNNILPYLNDILEILNPRTIILKLPFSDNKT